MKENCKAWHSRLVGRKSQHMITNIESTRGGLEYARKVTSGLSVLRLFFCEEAREGDNICIDLLLCYRDSLAIHLSHFVCL